MARDGEIIQMQHFFHHVDTIYHPNSSYATTKLYETSICGCNNNMIFQKEICLRFLPSMYAWKRSGVGDACQRGKMATLLNSLFSVIKNNYSVKYCDNIVKCAVQWYSM